ncbi:MAG: hypothetical protein HN994_03600 [Candidatus Marinimicrobia bacterium]|jgi:hypothetical protein|nr:hypothetical protein [Candidatus Neomarinimicrobiota bacterium]
MLKRIYLISFIVGGIFAQEYPFICGVNDEIETQNQQRDGNNWAPCEIMGSTRCG